MSSHIEGPLLRRSIPFLERWIAELVAAKEPQTDGGKGPHPPPQEQEPGAKNKKKAGKVAAPGAAPNAAAGEGSSMSKCHFVVGRVLDVRPHPESEKLYIEDIDLGAAGGRRTILSGLQQHVTRDEFMNRLVLVIANLEPRKIGGIMSEGMVLCASHTGEEESRTVSLLNVPEETPVGERVVFDGHEGPFEPVLKKKLAKHFEKVAADLRTNAKGEVVWGDVPFRTSRGVITAPITNGAVS